MFPNVAFIFNTRELKDVSKSAWWANSNTEHIISILKLADEKFKNYVLENPSFACHITYKDVVNKTEALKQLFRFLDAPYYDDNISKVLSTRHSY